MNPIDTTANPGEQKSIEWVMSRVGFCTGSRFSDVMDKLQSGEPAAKRTNYLYEIVAERLTGQPVQHFVNDAMLHGVEFEPIARMKYESMTGAMVAEQGFLHHPVIPFCGGSCDGLVGEDGMIEIKAPTTATHLKTLLSKECLHIPQIQGYLAITGRQWADYVSFDPRLPAPLDMYIQRIPRDGKYIEELEGQVIVFLKEVSALVAKLQGEPK